MNTLLQMFAGFAFGFLVGILEGFGDGFRVAGFKVGLLEVFGDGFRVDGFKVGQLLGLFLLFWQILATTHFAKYDTRV